MRFAVFLRRRRVRPSTQGPLHVKFIIASHIQAANIFGHQSAVAPDGGGSGGERTPMPTQSASLPDHRHRPQRSRNSPSRGLPSLRRESYGSLVGPAPAYSRDWAPPHRLDLILLIEKHQPSRGGPVILQVARRTGRRTTGSQLHRMRSIHFDRRSAVMEESVALISLHHTVCWLQA